MSFEYLCSSIVDTNLCAGCGLCAAICPKSIISINPQSLIPELADAVSSENSDCGECTLCSDVCIGFDTGTPAAELKLFGRTRTESERWLGIYNESLRGYSKDSDIFAKSSSGGCATSLLLASKAVLDVDIIVSAGRDSSKPWIAQSRISTDAGQLTTTCQSTYQLFPHLNSLRSLFAEYRNARIAIVGVPCHVQAIRKLQTLDNEWGEFARNNIVFVIEIACSSSTLPSATEKLISNSAINFKSVQNLKYREGSYPGNLCIFLDEGATVTIPFADAVHEFKAHKTHRCLSCGDWMSGLADVSICDGDPNIFKSSLDHQPKIAKHGRMLVRTAIGADVLGYAVESNLMEVWEGDVKGMNLGLERKRNRRKHYERSGLLISVSPIPGYLEGGEIIEDEVLLKTTE